MSTTNNGRHLKVSTRLLYDELLRRGTAVTILSNASSLLEYTAPTGASHLLYSTCSDKSAATGVVVATSKRLTSLLAHDMRIPCPAQLSTRDVREVRQFFVQYDHIVIKPINGSGGKGVTTNISTLPELQRAYAYAKTYSHTIVAEQHVEGMDVRLLVINGSFCSAVIRKPAHVRGDGATSITKLIDYVNASPLRNDDTQSSLMHIDKKAAHRYLGTHIRTVPVSGSETRVVGPANVSLGGSLHEATTLVTRAMIKDAEAITKKLGLGISGVDMIWDRDTNKHFLIEVNATPGIDIHNDILSGTKSNCVELYVDWLLA